MAEEELTQPNRGDKEILEKIQGLLGEKLEQVREIEFATQGYSVNEVGAVVELALWGLGIDDKKLQTLAETLGTLTSLTTLNLGNNKLTELPGLETLTSLTTLYLNSNQLKNIPKKFFENEWKVHWRDYYISDGINLYGNPLEVPPVEVVKKGREAVRKYFGEMEKGKKVLREVKVILLGDGSVGKTSLIKRLVFDKYNKQEPQTHGIYLQDWEIEVGGEEVKIHFWDFGGQDIMRATHQFFYTHRSLYVLVLHGRAGENHERWLKQIDNYGGDSPVIVVTELVNKNETEY